MKENIKYIEQWALLKIIDNYEIKNSITMDDSISIERVVRDIYATYPISMFRSLPNYSRLQVIKSLEWHEVLSMDNVHYVEAELRDTEEAYVNYDWFIVNKVREIKRTQRGAYV